MSIGINIGITPGIYPGIAIGISANPIGPGGGGIAGVTRDPTNLNYYPANASEWTNLMAAASLATGNPSSCWTFQLASGNPPDAIGSVALTSTMTIYQSAVPGASRVCIRDVDGTANHRLVNSTTAPNPSLTSTMELMFLDLPSAPAVVRDVCEVAANCDLRLDTTGKLRLIAGASADLVNVCGPAQQWVALQSNVTGSATKVYTNQEVFTGTFVLPTSATLLAFGGQSTAVSSAGYAYAAQFTGAAAELTLSQMRSLFQTLGAVVPW